MGTNVLGIHPVIDIPSHEGVGFEARIDRRKQSRTTLLLLTAKLICDGIEYACLVRDISSAGVKLELFHFLPESKQYYIEFKDGNRHSIDFVWISGNMCGFQFSYMLDTDSVIDVIRHRLPRRYLRLNTMINGQINFDSNALFIRITNISQHGACIEVNAHLSINQVIYMESQMFNRIKATILWRDDTKYGVIFHNPFKFEELARRLFQSNNPTIAAKGTVNS